MTYGDRLRKRWVVVRLLSGMRCVDVAWFYHHADAVGYARLLHQLDPGYRFEVVFDAGEALQPEDPARSTDSPPRIRLHTSS